MDKKEAINLKSKIDLKAQANDIDEIVESIKKTIGGFYNKQFKQIISDYRTIFDYTNNIDRASAINELRNYLSGSKSGNNIYVSESEYAKLCDSIQRLTIFSKILLTPKLI